MTIEFTSEVFAHLIKCNATDLDVARAAWVSQAGADAREKENGRVPGLIKFLYNNRHMSPFEHGSFTFMIECPLFVAREFHRHRTQSYNEVSARYTEMKPKFYVPTDERALVQEGKVGSYTFFRGNETQHDLVVRHIEKQSVSAWCSYKDMLAAGIAKEVARMVLPLNLYTAFYATVNPRNLMQFLDLRTDETALFEIRAVASQMETHLAAEMPLTYAAWKGL